MRQWLAARQFDRIDRSHERTTDHLNRLIAKDDLNPLERKIAAYLQKKWEFEAYEIHFLGSQLRYVDND
jgi:hypothetical protein